jgi:hypothetical protein
MLHILHIILIIFELYLLFFVRKYDKRPERRNDVIYVCVCVCVCVCNKERRFSVFHDCRSGYMAAAVINLVDGKMFRTWLDREIFFILSPSNTHAPIPPTRVHRHVFFFFFCCVRLLGPGGHSSLRQKPFVSSPWEPNETIYY